LNERLNADDYRKYIKVLVNKIGHPVDEGSFQPSRAMALPVYQQDKFPCVVIYIFQTILLTFQSPKLGRHYVDIRTDIYPVDEGSFQPSRAMALPVYQQDKYPFLYQHNDAPNQRC
jgi:hypothetical protein